MHLHLKESFFCRPPLLPPQILLSCDKWRANLMPSKIILANNCKNSFTFLPRDVKPDSKILPPHYFNCSQQQSAGAIQPIATQIVSGFCRAQAKQETLNCIPSFRRKGTHPQKRWRSNRRRLRKLGFRLTLRIR